MEKVLKTIKIITVTLLIVLLSIVAFWGTYSKQNHVWRQTTPEFNYGIELGETRELRYVLDTSEETKDVYVDESGKVVGEVKEYVLESEKVENTSKEKTETTTEPTVISDEFKPQYAVETRTIKSNEDNVKTIDNFEKSKKIIQKRLENEDVYEYNIRLDNITGELILEVPDDDQVSVVHTAVTSIGNFEIIDAQTGVVLLDNSDIKKVESGMYQADTGYQACLQVYFNNEGKEKLKEISNKYIQVVNDAGESKSYNVSVNLNNQTITTTYFGEELSNGVMQIAIGSTTTESATINAILEEIERMADEVNEEKLPIAYSLSSDSIVESRISKSNIQLAVIIFAVVVLIISIVLVIKFKLKGFVSAILGIGFIAVLNLLVRYTEIYVTLNSIIAFIGVLILNYTFMKLFLLEREKEEYIKDAFLSTMKKYYLLIIPVCIIAIVFTFVSNIIISSVGMMLFWGLLLQAVYNTITILGLGLI